MKKANCSLTFIICLSLFSCGQKDQEGNSFSTVKIVKQVWMAENLNVEHYRNGDPIPQVQDNGEWERLTTGAWCYYENIPSNGEKYGKLYNWYAVNDPRGLAPEGWHVPTLSEFKELTKMDNMGYYRISGNALKAVGEGYKMKNGNLDGAGTNESGFSALLAGSRLSHSLYVGFAGLGAYAHFWCLTDFDESNAFEMELNRDNGLINLDNNKKSRGYSVRCIKD
jgi:uncharacterized protein (TIGR02145 family)